MTVTFNDWLAFAFIMTLVFIFVWIVDGKDNYDD